ncbi:MAG: hypothetical protein AB1489_14545 [Acidobacteriota bacterium]
MDNDGNIFAIWLDDSYSNQELFVVSIPPFQVDVQSDFTITANPLGIKTEPGKEGQFSININRTGGFNGNVTITVPDSLALKIKLTPKVQATNDTTVNFNFKVKKKVLLGSLGQAIFTARDDNGRIRTGTLTFFIGD